MILTERDNMILRAALSYTHSNVDDLNEALQEEDGIGVLVGEPFTEEEVENLAKKLGYNPKELPI